LIFEVAIASINPIRKRFPSSNLNAPISKKVEFKGRVRNKLDRNVIAS